MSHLLLAQWQQSHAESNVLLLYFLNLTFVTLAFADLYILIIIMSNSREWPNH